MIDGMTEPAGSRPARPGHRWLRLWPVVTGVVSALAAAALGVAMVLVFWFWIASAVVVASPDELARTERRLDLWTRVALWSGSTGGVALAATVVGWVVVRRVLRAPRPPDG